MGKLIIIEGLDGCGKSTQTKLLEEYFEKIQLILKKSSFRIMKVSRARLLKCISPVNLAKMPQM